jgi:hypothetical protein
VEARKEMATFKQIINGKEIGDHEGWFIGQKSNEYLNFLLKF